MEIKNKDLAEMAMEDEALETVAGGSWFVDNISYSYTKEAAEAKRSSLVDELRKRMEDEFRTRKEEQYSNTVC